MIVVTTGVVSTTGGSIVTSGAELGGRNPVSTGDATHGGSSARVAMPGAGAGSLGRQDDVGPVGVMHVGFASDETVVAAVVPHEGTNPGASPGAG